jgi:hypothetical protein
MFLHQLPRTIVSHISFYENRYAVAYMDQKQRMLNVNKIHGMINFIRIYIKIGYNVSHKYTL